MNGLLSDSFPTDPLQTGFPRNIAKALDTTPSPLPPGSIELIFDGDNFKHTHVGLGSLITPLGEADDNMINRLCDDTVAHIDLGGGDRVAIVRWVFDNHQNTSPHRLTIRLKRRTAAFNHIHKL